MRFRRLGSVAAITTRHQCSVLPSNIAPLRVATVLQPQVHAPNRSSVFTQASHLLFSAMLCGGTGAVDLCDVMCESAAAV